MLDDLKKNIGHERKIIKELGSLDSSDNPRAAESLRNQMKMLNKTVPALLKKVSNSQDQPQTKDVSRFSYISPSTKEKRFITINKQDKKSFLKELSLSEKHLAGLKKRNKPKDQKGFVNKPNPLANISSRIFGGVASKYSKKFSSLAEDLRKANIRFLTSTYLAIALFVSFFVLVLGLIGVAIFLVFDLGFIIYIWIPFALFAVSLIGFYFYPASERGSVQKSISQELPFATIHMAAIAGSDIEPTKIFRIIAMSKEYSYIGKEIIKVINQVDVYGYDLVSSLRNIAKQTSNKRLSELFNGLAINISSGGELKAYLEKKAEDYLMDYKLERQKYASLAGTFMDIYISVLIAAPLVLMMLFVVMNVSGLGLSLGIKSLLAISVGLVILLNIIFLVVLQFKQPKV